MLGILFWEYNFIELRSEGSDVPRFLKVLLMVLMLESPSLKAVELTPENVESALDFIFHEITLLTVGGVIPISVLEGSPIPQGFQDMEEFGEFLIRAQDMGYISNPNLKFSLINDQELALFNIEASRALLNDEEAIALIEDSGGERPGSIAELFELFSRSFSEIRYENVNSSYLNHIVSGVCLGYPPSEVEEYAKKISSEKNYDIIVVDGVEYKLERVLVGAQKDRVMVSPRSLPGFRINGYARFTNQGIHRDQAYVERAERLQVNYVNLRNSSRTATEIWNDPDQLLQGVGIYGAYRYIQLEVCRLIGVWKTHRRNVKIRRMGFRN